MPHGFKDFTEPQDWLTFAEIERVVGVFAWLGVEHIRVTGGEPLVRNHVEQLVERLARLDGVGDLSMSTNALRLAKLAPALSQAGLQRLNVSLDSIRKERYREITGGGKLEKTLAGLEQAREVGIDPIKINCVVMKGINDDEIDRILEYCAERGFTLRLIETMPVGDTGRAAQAGFVSLEEIRKQLAQHYDLIPDIMPGAGPARYYRLKGSDTKIGFITPISQHFCASCNRLRLSCQGDIFTCLGDESRYPLRECLRSGCGDEELVEHIRKAIDLKPRQHEFDNKRQKVVRLMSMTGG
jgi:cyclic pyranopterin phosphate synthase